MNRPGSGWSPLSPSNTYPEEFVTVDQGEPEFLGLEIVQELENGAGDAPDESEIAKLGEGG